MYSVLLLLSASLLVARAQESCTNGRVWSDCAAGCVKTCDDPYPICPAVCVARCHCPADKPVWDNNRCIAMEQCKQSCTNGRVWNDCASACVSTCDDPVYMCTLQCVARCHCPPDKPVWNNNRCIPQDQCSASCTNGRVWSDCASACVKTCDNPDPTCTEQCVKRCHCPPDKPIWDNNRCIAKDQCSKSCEGGQVWNDCGSACTATCDDPVPVCTKQCSPGCHCPPGQLWEAGHCITKGQCAYYKECAAQAASGPCKAYMPSWAYNMTTKTCEQFIYGGCDGNKNRYSTEDECMETCEEASGASGAGGSFKVLILTLVGLYSLL